MAEIETKIYSLWMTAPSKYDTTAKLHFNALTGLRFLAASMVFIYHNRKYWRADLHPEVLRLFNEFHIGVALLYVLSGFLISYVYGAEPLRSGGSYLRYMLLRCARILPLYWLILLAYYLDPAYGKGNPWLTFSLLHGFSDRLNLDGLAQAWSLNVEICFYLLAPLLCFLQRKHILYLLGMLLFLFGVSWGIGQIWYAVDGNPDRFFYPIKFLFMGSFVGRSSEFLAGMFLAELLRNGKIGMINRIPYKTVIGFVGIVLTAYLIGLFQIDIYHQGRDTMGGYLIHALLLPVFVLFVIAGLMYEESWMQDFLASRILVVLGNASFIFYLIHISYVSLKIRHFFLLPDRNFVVLWLLSILLYYAVEKPIYGFCRKRLK